MVVNCNSASNRPASFSASLQNLPSATPEMRRNARFNSIAQKRTERGKSSFNSRNSATSRGLTSAPWMDL